MAMHIDNNRFMIKDLVLVEFLKPITLIDPKAVIHRQGEEEDLEFYTKSEMFQWLAVNSYQEIAIFENGDCVWATPSEGWD